MNQLSYIDYRNYYANKCILCKGETLIVEDGVRKECICQKMARRTYRLEQIDIYPPELKYKTWSDFNGVIKQQGRITGHLKAESVKSARDLAFYYCYGKLYDPAVLNHRRQNLCIHKHLSDGQNVIIVGEERVGRSLLASLICQEVSNATVILNKDIDYRWIKFYDILNASRWVYDLSSGLNKPVNHAYLDMLSELDFLFIDGVELQRGKNYPVDHIAINSTFGHRLIFHKPTIVVCSRKFMQLLESNAGKEQACNTYGSEFVQIFRKQDNVIIELIKDG